jgi:hypothetical protein
MGYYAHNNDYYSLLNLYYVASTMFFLFHCQTLDIASILYGRLGR